MTTQEERSSVTREKTIAATIDCLIELGYPGATIAAVAERAGISRGAVSHQYPDKSRLVVDVIEEIARRRLAEAHSALGTLAGSRRIEVGLDELWADFKKPIFLAALELFVGARNDPHLHPRVLRLECDIDESIRELIRSMAGPVGDAADAAALTVHADVLINTMRGLAVMHATGAPQEPLERAWIQARADALAALRSLAR
ncbi:MAG TPA: TetR/AcrR family transcriptional regulator [Pseudonocardia sp.]|nr:TetR/AcrR family transcriptional regulator [Pseudonocardia sp.]